MAIAALDDLGAVLRRPAFRGGGDLVGVDLPDGRRATFPAPLFQLDGVRGTFRNAAPAPGEPAGAVNENAPLAVQTTKRIARGITDGTVPSEDTDWARSAEEGTRLMNSADAMEGMRAFAEERAPDWTGR